MKALLSAVALLVICPATALLAQGQAGPVDIAHISVEDLMKVEITSAGKKEQAADDVAAAVYVITQDDIKRSGFHSLPELFRLVPGMQVAQVNANKWAVSTRGFNDLFSNKLLVLIDGRTLYSRSFSGVFWDGEDLLLQDIERIEVIRGPGGTTWGANAVNGVINIITKSASETKGAAAEVTAGTFEQGQAAIRYGGSLGEMSYRLYTQRTEIGNSLDSTSASAQDKWESNTAGGRADWSHGRDAVMAEASFSTGQSRPHWYALGSPSVTDPPSTDGISDVQSSAFTGRWTHTSQNGSSFHVQAFRIQRERNESTLWSSESINDVDLQYQTKLGARHDVVAGGGYRKDDFLTHPTFTLNIPSGEGDVFNTFIQDEIGMGRSVKVTVGSKLEHDEIAGWGTLPSVRAIWNVTPTRHRVWAAVSRARRTPSLAERGMRLYFGAVPGDTGVPVVFGVVGNPDFQTEVLTNVEAGYRFRIRSNAAVDITAFRGRYDHLSTLEPIAPTFISAPNPFVFVPTQYQNLLSAVTSGLEITGYWSPTGWLRLDGSYSGFHATPHADAASQDPAALAFDANAPQHQWQLHESWFPTTRLRIDGALYHVGALQVMGTDAYSRVDARVEFKINHRLSAFVNGQNLLDPTHEEYTSMLTPVLHTAIPRSGKVSLSWMF
jgi:iron complex outermembrane receptor protein